ncbi:MAG: hypothetical protein WCI40_08600, partial [Verrucomicrobiota bacterium]
MGYVLRLPVCIIRCFLLLAELTIHALSSHSGTDWPYEGSYITFITEVANKRDNFKLLRLEVLQAELARGHLDEILHSKTFRGSSKLCKLLKHIVECSLAEPPDPPKEQVLGIEMFDRRPDWDPQSDSIVRVQVGRLRLKLLEYYENTK